MLSDAERVLHDLGTAVFGYDWSDIIERYNRWVDANPEQAIRYAEALVTALQGVTL